jgi:hypothetical protein
VHRAPALVWKVKEQKKEKPKRVSFADPIAIELKLPKHPISDDSILLIKGTPSSPIHFDDTDHVVVVGDTWNTSCAVANSTIQSSSKEKDGEKDGFTVSNPSMSKQIIVTSTGSTEPVSMTHVVIPDNAYAVVTEPDGLQNKTASRDYSAITPSEETPNSVPSNIPQIVTDCHVVEATANCTTPNSLPMAHTEQDIGRRSTGRPGDCTWAPTHTGELLFSH